MVHYSEMIRLSVLQSFDFIFSVGYPLTVIGGILGKNYANGFDAPCRTKNIAREIPDIPWYRTGLAHCIVGGFLPFR